MNSGYVDARTAGLKGPKLGRDGTPGLGNARGTGIEDENDYRNEKLIAFLFASIRVHSRFTFPDRRVPRLSLTALVF
jgi:hypothetical protein